MQDFEDWCNFDVSSLLDTVIPLLKMNSSYYYYILIPFGAVSFVFLIRKLREYQWGWVRNKSALTGKIYIITGANTGLGFETTKALVKRNAKVILACRNADKAREGIANIRKCTGKGEMVFEELNLASFDSIRSFAGVIRKKHPIFNCIIFNAGLATRNNQFTEEHYEIHFGVNYLGHFYLFQLLEEEINKNKSRIVVVSSKMHEKGEIDFKTLGEYVEEVKPRRTNPYYNNSKLANFYFARELYKKGYDVHVLCPGLCHTHFFRDYNIRWYHYVLFAPMALLFLRSAEQGAQNIIYCATDNVNTEAKNPATGYYVRNLKQTKSKVKFSEHVSEQLWKESASVCLPAPN